MARLLYGGTGADILLSDADSDDIPEFATGTYTAWTTRTGSTQITDLLDFTGAATTTVTSLTTTGSEGRVLFSGPDGYTAGIWLRDEAHTSYTRWLVAPIEDMATRAGTTDHGALTGLTPDDDHPQYFNTTRGDARYYTKTQEDAQQVRLTGAQTIAGVKTFSSAPVIPDASLTIAKTSGLQAALDLKLTTSSNIQALANVSDAVLTDGDIHQYDAGTGQMEPIDLAGSFAAVDASTGRIVTSAEPQWYVPIVVINEGDPVPANFPANGIVFSRPAAPTLLPVPAGNNSSVTSATVAVTTTQPFAVGDYIGFGIGTSGEVTLPSTYSVTYGVGAGAKSTAFTASQTGSAQNDLHYARVTTAIPTGTVITITANQNRTHFMVSLVKMINLASTAVLDAAAGNQAGPSLSMSITSAPTTLANEIALASFTSNPGTGAVTRTMTGSGGWTAVGPTVTAVNVGGTTARSLAVFYKVLTATAAQTATVTVNSSDGSGAAWAGTLATFKGA